MLSRTPKTPSNLRQSSTGNTPQNEEEISSAVENNLMNLSFRGSDIGNKFSLKEQEKLMEEMKRENFDLKLKLSQSQEKLSKLNSGNLERILEEREQLIVKNEAIMSEVRQYRDLLEAARMEIEEANQRSRRNSSISDANEANRIAKDLEAANLQIAKLHSIIKKLESQIKVYEDESRDSIQKMRQLELDANLAQRRTAEARNSVEVMQGEITYLEEQLRAKDDTISKFRQEVYGNVSEFNQAARQVSELQAALKKLEMEKEELIRERETLKRSQELSLSKAVPMTPGNVQESPRSSLDGFESLIYRKVGETVKYMQDLEKKTNLTKSEKENLQAFVQQLSNAVNAGIASAYDLSKNILEAISVKKMLKNDIQSLPEAMKQLEDVCSIAVQQNQEFKEQNNSLEILLQNTSETLEKVEAEKIRLLNKLHQSEETVKGIQSNSEEKERELNVLREECKWMKEKIRRANEEEIPALRTVVFIILILGIEENGRKTGFYEQPVPICS